MKISHLLVSTFLIAGTVTSSPARAAIIPVTNFSFEADVAPGDRTGVPLVTGWTTQGTVLSYNTDATQLENANDNSSTRGVPTGGLGKQSAVLSGIANATSSSIGSIAANRSYKLTVAFGDGYSFDGGNQQIGFKVGNAFTGNSLLNFTASSAKNEGKFKDVTFTYVPTASDIGQQIQVYFGQTSTQIGSGGFEVRNVAYDNIRVDSSLIDPSIVATPEPSTWAMMGLGCLAMVGMGYKHRKSEQVS